MEKWHDFFVASAGASAALMGLLFVGLSLNLSKILALPVLTSRALIACMLLLSILIQTLLLLVPYESDHYAGLCILIIVVLTWPYLSFLDLTILKKIERPFRNGYLWKMIFDQIALLPYFIGGVMLLNGSGSGYYFLVGSVIASFIKASLDAWVLLVEINR